MSVNASSEICYGVRLVEDGNLIWDDFNSGLDEWWAVKVLGFKASFAALDEEGDVLEETEEAYYDEMASFTEGKPECPVELTNYNKYMYPKYILSLVGIEVNAVENGPDAFTLKDLDVTEEQKETLLKFCSDYKIEYIGEPSLFLIAIIDV